MMKEIHQIRWKKLHGHLRMDPKWMCYSKQKMDLPAFSPFSIVRRKGPLSISFSIWGDADFYMKKYFFMNPTL